MSSLRLLYYTKFMMWIALTCKIYIAWGMNSFILPHPFINFCILLWREKVFPVDLMLSLIRSKIIYRVQHIFVPKRQVPFLILTRRWKRTDNIFRVHKSEVDFCKKIHLHQWNIPKFSVLVSIKHKTYFKNVGNIYHLIYLPTYRPTYVPTYPPIHLPLCLHICIWGIRLSLSLRVRFPCRNARHSNSSTDLLLTVFLIATSILPSESPLGYLCIFLSGYILCIPPTFHSRSPAIRCNHRCQQNSFFFLMKPVICGQQSIFSAQHGTKCLTGVFSRPCLWALSAVRPDPILLSMFSVLSPTYS